jgi:hypothetical protein
MTTYFPVDATYVDDDTVIMSPRTAAPEAAIAGQ